MPQQPERACAASTSLMTSIPEGSRPARGSSRTSNSGSCSNAAAITLIRVLLGLTHADAGTMSLLGFSVPRHRDLALARVGASVSEPRFHGHLTGRQNLQIVVAARERAARERIVASLERGGMMHRADDRV